MSTFGLHHCAGPILIRTTRHCGFNASPTPKRKAGRVLIAAHRGHSGEEARAAPLMPPRLVHCPRQRGCKNLSGDAHKFEPRYVVVFRFNVRLSVAPGPAAVTPKERKSSGSLVPGF